MNSRSHEDPTIRELIIFGLFFHCILSIYCALEFPDLNLDFHPLEDIREHGYPTEVHMVITEDGFILSLYRIPKIGGQPVLFHPALLSDATCYLFANNDSLPYLLAEEGYDIWFGNYRGTVYSKEHVNYTWNDREYWDWSWAEMGIYDIPAFVKYIYAMTNKKSINIGHSMGTTTLAVGLSTHPNMKDYMLGAFLLAPTVYLSHTKTSGRAFLKYMDLMQNFHFLSNSIRFQIIMRNLYEVIRKGCSANRQNALRCLKIFDTVMGPDPDQVPDTDDLTILRNYPRITSIHTLIHYGQLMVTGVFQQYNWGIRRNLQRYGTIKPPVFDLGKITVPVALFHAKNDYFGVTEDIDHLWRELSDDCKYIRYLVPYKSFNHVDFLTAKDVKVLFYDKFLEILRDFVHDKV